MSTAEAERRRAVAAVLAAVAKGGAA